MRIGFAALAAIAVIGAPAAAKAADAGDDYGYEDQGSYEPQRSYERERTDVRRVEIEEDEPYEERVVVRRAAPVYVDVLPPPAFYGPRVVYRGWGPGPRFYGHRRWARRGRW